VIPIVSAILPWYASKTFMTVSFSVVPMNILVLFGKLIPFTKKSSNASIIGMTAMAKATMVTNNIATATEI